MNGFEEDARLCFYVGNVSRLYTFTANIKFRDLKDEHGQPLIRGVRVEMLRPKPLVFVYDYKSGDAVEIWEDDRWYKGMFVAMSYHPKVYCKIYRPEGESGVFCRRRDVRPA